jgi:hypothetical protein
MRFPQIYFAATHNPGNAKFRPRATGLSFKIDFSREAWIPVWKSKSFTCVEVFLLSVFAIEASGDLKHLNIDGLL